MRAECHVEDRLALRRFLEIWRKIVAHLIDQDHRLCKIVRAVHMEITRGNFRNYRITLASP